MAELSSSVANAFPPVALWRRWRGPHMSGPRLDVQRHLECEDLVNAMYEAVVEGQAWATGHVVRSAGSLVGFGHAADIHIATQAEEVVLHSFAQQLVHSAMWRMTNHKTAVQARRGATSMLRL